MNASRRRPRREVETPRFLEAVGRMLTAAARRVGDGDPAEFGQLVQFQRQLDEVLVEAVRGLRRSGMTWQEIGDAAGETRQGAHKRWAHRVEGPSIDQAAD